MLRSHFLLTACLAVSLCVAQDPVAKAPAWTTWKGAGVSLAYPTEWTADATGVEGTTLVLFSPLDSGDVFRENINLLIQDATGVDLPSYISTTEEQVRTQLTEGTMLHSGTQRNSTGEYHEFEYTGVLNGLPLHWKQVVRIRGGQAYLLSFTAHRDAWDEMLYLADAVLDSFQWSEQ